MQRNVWAAGILIVVSLVVIMIGVTQLNRPAGNEGQAPAGPTPTIAEVRRISATELHARLQGPNPPLVWEIRSLEAFLGGHVPGSRQVQFADIPMLAQRLDRNTSIVLLCA